MNQAKSNAQYDTVIDACTEEFVAKSKKYGNSLVAYDTYGILSKIFIKLYRIRSIQKAGEYKVDGESIEKEFPGVINYCLYGIIEANRTAPEPFEGDVLFEEYSKASTITKALFQKKNHDYGEAWRDLSVSYMTQECICKYLRMKKIYEDLKFDRRKTADLQKEFVEVFSDICNYSIFCSILITEGVSPLI